MGGVALFGLPSKASRPLDPQRLALPRDLPAPTRPSAALVPSGPAQRVILYEEDAHDPPARKFSGSVVWGTALVPGTDGEVRELRGEITIPERKASVAWSLRRNSDPALPASHVLELRFAMPADTRGGGVQNVPGILVKQSEEARGKPVAALPVRLADSSFQLGLLMSDAQSERDPAEGGKLARHSPRFTRMAAAPF